MMPLGLLRRNGLENTLVSGVDQQICGYSNKKKNTKYLQLLWKNGSMNNLREEKEATIPEI